MKIFNSIPEYLNESKLNQIVVFGGLGITDGIKNLSSKHDTYKICRISDDQIHFKSFRGKSVLTIHKAYYNQQIALLTPQEFKQLPTLW